MLKYVGYDIVFREVPDEVTLAINLSCCPNHCKGCHSAYLQQNVGELLTEEALWNMLTPYEGEVTCVAFMGGDGDAAEVARLAAKVKAREGNRLHTAWYSGRPTLPDGLPVKAFDYIKLGPYEAAHGPLDHPTTNQKFYFVTETGELEDRTFLFWKK